MYMSCLALVGIIMARNPDKGLYVTLDTGDSTYITRAKPLSIKVPHLICSTQIDLRN